MYVVTQTEPMYALVSSYGLYETRLYKRLYKTGTGKRQDRQMDKQRNTTRPAYGPMPITTLTVCQCAKKREIAATQLYVLLPGRLNRRLNKFSDSSQLWIPSRT